MNGWRLRPDQFSILNKIPPLWAEYDKPLLLKAQAVQEAIFKAAPEIKDFIKDVQSTSEKRGWVRDFFGRRYKLPKRELSYKIPNHLIQGGCATIMKIAMNRIREFFRSNDLQSRMVLTIHDEIDFEIHESEVFVIPEILRMMKTAYPHNHLEMEVDAEIAKKSLADKEEWKDAS
jgi:DNA polymerase-1